MPPLEDWVLSWNIITERSSRRHGGGIEMRFLRLGNLGMRGVAGTGLTPHNVIAYASAVGTYFSGGRIAVGMDSRISSKMYRDATVSGLLGCGAEVIDAGICPAPMLHHLVCREHLSGAVLIGAGHHQAGWNAVVPLSSRGSCFTRLQTQELLGIYHSGIYRTVPWNAIGKIHPCPEGLAASYLDLLCTLVNAERIAACRFKVIADFCNGSGSVLAEAFAERFGVELIPINQVLSGVLPHDPEPRPRTAMQVQSLIKVLNADIGFVFNSDMSRASIVTDSGETLSEEYSFPIVADHVLHRAGAETGVVSNCCTTRTLDDIVRMRGGVLFKGKVGQAHTIDLMFETGAVLSGDGSGSIALARGVPGFDGFLLMALVLESMACSSETSSRLASRLPRYHIIKRAVPCSSSHAYSVLRSLRGSLFPDAVFSEEDGLRFDWPEGWVHLRASMTEPIVRMIVEWKTREKAEEYAAKVSSIIERVVAS